MTRNQFWPAWRLLGVALALILTGLLAQAAPSGHGLSDQDVAATIAGEVHAGRLLGDAAGASPDDQTYVENFMTYTAKSYTDNAQWDVFQHRLALSPYAGGMYAQPAIMTDGTGGAYVVWQDLRNNQSNGDWDIYAQRVDSRGNRLWPADVRVNSAPAPGYQAAPAVVVDSQGNAIVIWAESLEVPFAVYAQKVSPAGQKLWPADVRVNGAPAYRTDWGPRDSLAAALDGQDNVIVVWQGSATNNWSDPDVLAQKIGPNGQRRWTNDVKVNSDSGHHQRFMAVDVSPAGVSVVAWVDERHGGEDIYAQRLDSQGNRVWPSEVKVSAGAGVRLQGDPNVVLDDQTHAFVVWRQGPSDAPSEGATSTIYAQRLLSQGSLAWAGNVRINRDTAPVFRGRPRAALAPGGDAIVVWEDNREGYSHRDIFSQRLAPTGALRWAQDEPLSPADWWGQGSPDVSMTGNRAAIVLPASMCSSWMLLPVRTSCRCLRRSMKATVAPSSGWWILRPSAQGRSWWPGAMIGMTTATCTRRRSTSTGNSCGRSVWKSMCRTTPMTGGRAWPLIAPIACSSCGITTITSALMAGCWLPMASQSGMAIAP